MLYIASAAIASISVYRHYTTEKSYIRSVNKSLIKVNKIINGNYEKMKKSSAEVNLTDDSGNQ